ncbi:hypothetical protein E2562_021887 [Oryza meyeriana var. granulata]|uniref:Uncharacterized protein n=1 Tax=Oryza meyeriana var. granulata TaxID=110450 RepID=A0A6G1C9R8_9ORYZ|nr:hypothetical protein E2562_021887 [Oryza meyeriana var. granulata]
MNVTVGSPEELREVAEEPRASEEWLTRVAISGVRVSQAQEMLALVRDKVEALLWSVDEAAMAALKAAAEGAARLEELSEAMDAVVRDTEEGLPLPASGPRSKLLTELAHDVCAAARPPTFLHRRYTAAGIEALDIGGQAKAISYYRFSDNNGGITPGSLESSTSYFRQAAEKARARIALLLGMTIPFEQPIVVHILKPSSWDDRFFSNSNRNV